MNTLKKILKSNKYIKTILLNLINLYRKLFYSIYCKINKIDDHLIIFESFMGRNYADSGQAIYEEMLKDSRFDDYTFVWSFKDPESKKNIESLKRAILVNIVL